MKALDLSCLAPKCVCFVCLRVLQFQRTPGSMNSLFSDLFREFWRGILGGVRDYLGEVLGGF